jgi:signal transduction histidine kinase/CheY-like chemotaxis protein
MQISRSIDLPATRNDVRALLREMQDEAIWYVVLAFAAFGVLLIQIIHTYQGPSKVTFPCLVLYAMLGMTWAARRWGYLVSAWLLVGCCSTLSLLLVIETHLHPAVGLLTIAVGVAAIFISLPAGAIVAFIFTLLLSFLPVAILPVESELRVFSIIGLWATIGFIWLTFKPILTTLDWSWHSYEQSRKLLEEARDRQVELKQVLADLADANSQLTRLNRLSQALRQSAEEARRIKEEFVANVSHELRTPLNMIIGFCEIIVKTPHTYGGKIPPALLADLTVVLRNSQHLSSLIDDVLDLSRVEAGRMALTKERVRFEEIIEAAFTALRPLYESKGLYLKSEAVGEIPAVFCDRTRIREVILNLLSNAGRFTDKGGVDLQISHEGNDVLISVADTGPGISEADKERIFKPFQQADGSIRRKYGGTGLGLSISRALVELHGGQMWFESPLGETISNNGGQGTIFYFRLPIDPPMPVGRDASSWMVPNWEYRERSQRSNAPVPVVPPRYIVVEQDYSLARILRSHLDGSEIIVKCDLNEAIKELERIPAQAVILNDAPVLESMQRLQTSPLPYGVLAIACFQPGLRQAAVSLGISNYLIKPISREQLLGALDSLNRPVNTILIVDDEPEALRLFQRILISTNQRYRILTAGDGRQALEILRNEQVDVVLLDLVMPEMDGFLFLDIRVANPVLSKIPVIVISAQDPEGQQTMSHSVGFTRGGGVSTAQLLSCIQTLNHIFVPPGQISTATPEIDRAF